MSDDNKKTASERPFTAEELSRLVVEYAFGSREAAGETHQPVRTDSFRRLLAAAKRDSERECFVNVNPSIVVGKPRVWDRALSKEEIAAVNAALRETKGGGA